MKHRDQYDSLNVRLRTVAEVAAILGVSTDFIYREVAARRLAAYRLRGHSIRIELKAVLEYLERHHQSSLETIKTNRIHF